MGLAGARRAWDREYAEVRAYTTSYRSDLDRGVHFLLAYLSARGESIEGPVLDCGCGIGRNALPLARAGYEIIGLEHSGAALERFRQDIEEQGLPDRITLIQHDLNEPLPLDDGGAALVLDVTAVDNLVDERRRRGYGKEVGRVLCPGGLALVVTFAVDDGYYGRWLSASPSVEQGIVEDPNTAIRTQLFTRDKLDGVFVPPLKREIASSLVFVDAAAGRSWTRRFLIHLYRRPA